jgi:hypothetical protein
LPKKVVTVHRFQRHSAVFNDRQKSLAAWRGAVVLYLNLAVIGASAFSLIWALSPTAFATLAAPTGGPDEFATMLYFQPDDFDHDRLRRHRSGRPVRPQPGQSEVGSRAVLPRHHGCAARDP